jgi:predicted nucleic acid-binding protein
MGWVDDLRGHLVGVDSAPLIYYVEDNPTYISVVAPFFEALRRGELTAVTSMVTLAEVLVYPLRVGDAKLAQKHRELLLKTRGLTTISLSAEIAEETARLRSLYNIRTPDAIQVATAIKASASCFLTNDKGLSSVSDIQVLTLDEISTRPAS